MITMIKRKKRFRKPLRKYDYQKAFEAPYGTITGRFVHNAPNPLYEREQTITIEDFKNVVVVDYAELERRAILYYGGLAKEAKK